ncbi:MAG: hypothetical protein OXF56_21105, partial [Rhodobacteraceae bacterium]|nr:hypothetical protein [Paracoccaceae bacterium]
ELGPVHRLLNSIILQEAHRTSNFVKDIGGNSLHGGVFGVGASFPPGHGRSGSRFQRARSVYPGIQNYNVAIVM